MQKLTRKLRKSLDGVDADGFSLPTRDDSRPIDTQKQEELVRTMEKSQAEQSLLWRIVFSGLVSCYAVFLVYSICQQAYYPWDLERLDRTKGQSDGEFMIIMLICIIPLYMQRYHAYFMYEIDSGSILAAEGATLLVCLMLIAGLMHKSTKRHLWLWYSFVPGTMLAIFWLHHMQRLAKFRWDIIWLPLAPLCGTGICLYVDSLLKESYEEVKKLREYMYAYKAY